MKWKNAGKCCAVLLCTSALVVGWAPSADTDPGQVKRPTVDSATRPFSSVLGTQLSRDADLQSVKAPPAPKASSFTVPAGWKPGAPGAPRSVVCPPGALFGQEPTPRSGIWSFGTSDELAYYRIFENLRVTGLVCDLHWWGGGAFLAPSWVGCDKGPSEAFNIAFWNDAGGIPDIAGGPIAEYLGILPDTRLFTGESYAGFVDMIYYEVLLLNPCSTIFDGWVSIEGVTAADCWFMWASSGDTGEGFSYQENAREPVLDFDLGVCLTGTYVPAFGACCDDFTGVCTDGVEIINCEPPLRFTVDTLCNDIAPPCGQLLGACCDFGQCVGTMTPSQCLAMGPNALWFEGEDCGTFDCPVPGPSGACCISGQCTPNLIEAVCDFQGGVWGREGSVCSGNDCNQNGGDDFCDIIEGISGDCNVNGIPDECEPGDCDGNGVLDECDCDCDNDGIVDGCEVIGAPASCGTAQCYDGLPWGQQDDCQPDGVPDECQLSCGRDGGDGSVCIETLFGNNNAGSLGGAVYFDVTPLSGDVTVESYFTNTGQLVPSFGFSVYTTPGTYAGNESNPIVWTLVATGTGVGMGEGNPSPVTLVAPFALTAGETVGMALVMGPEAGHRYTNGTGSNQYFADAAVALDLGSTSNTPFGGTTFTNRVWNGRICYAAGGLPCDENPCPGDCNANGIPDDCDIAGCTGDPMCGDCNANGVMDQCEWADCNANGQLDECDIALGVADDCQGDGIPDLCQVPASAGCPLGICTTGCLVDCDENCVPDECDIALCPPGDPLCDDCNGTSIPDICDINSGASMDINGNWIPDECESDCNNNGILDECELDCSFGNCSSIPGCGQRDDCNGNGVPDTCDTGCEGGGGSTYQWDDGSTENAFGLTVGGEVCWIVHFDTISGQEEISSIQTTYGRFASGSPGVAPGDNIRVYIWHDPDGDGNPADAVLLAEANAPADAAAIATNVLQDIAIGPVVVPGSSFFIGVSAVIPANTHPYPMDQGQPQEDEAWLGYVVGSVYDPYLPGGDEPAPLNMTAIGFPCNAVARASTIQGGGADDCNGNCVPDTCEVQSSPGCVEGNCDPAGGPCEDDCNENCIPDTCESDCNGNGIADECDITNCGPGELWCQDCNGNTLPDICEADCNGNGIADECDISNCGPGEAWCGDCNWNLIPNECEVPPLCPTCPDCQGDLIPDECQFGGAGSMAITYHVSARVEPWAPYHNKVFRFDDNGVLINGAEYDQIAGAISDSWGYRDGCTDGTHVYFGWDGGLARHDADGSNGIRLVAGPAPSDVGTWRALAFDPDGDGGHGSIWVANFESALIEVDLSGNLLNSFPNGGYSLFGLAMDFLGDGNLWGHDSGGVVIKIDKTTGAIIPGSGWVAGPWGNSTTISQGGLSNVHDGAGSLAAISQGGQGDFSDKLGIYDLAGAFIAGPWELDSQTNTVGHLGVAVTGGSIGGLWNDCNNNGIPDECDIGIEFGGFCQGGSPPCSNDYNGNGVPDECEVACESCIPDVNSDGYVNGLDAHAFVDCAFDFASHPGCGCADLVRDFSIDEADIPSFVAALLNEPGLCPDPDGACCDAGNCLGTMLEIVCDMLGGDWLEGEDCASFQCPPLGACCEEDGNCIGSILEVDCVALGGAFHAGQDCATYQCPTQGETCADATTIPGLPFADSGDTSTYADDYDELCSWWSTSNDRVYAYTPATSEAINIVLCAGLTAYDTKLYVYENNCPTPGSGPTGNPYACNDDYCIALGGQPYVSQIWGLALTGGNTYYIVIDGYHGFNGYYELNISN